MSDDAFLEFVAESEDNLELFERKMLELESSPGSLGVINEIFRAVHTIKGTAGFFSFSKIESLGHAGENVLGALRDRKLQLDPNITSLLLRTGDALRGFLESIKSSGDEGAADSSGLTEELKAVLLAALSMPTGAFVVPVIATPAIATPVIAAPEAAPSFVPALLPSTAEPSRSQVVPAKATPHHKRAQMPSADFDCSEEFVVPVKSAEAGESIRIDVTILEGLMDLVGEMVLTRNQLMQAAAPYEETQLFPFIQRMSALTSELQEGITKTRMQPINNVWQKLPRVVRDLAQACNKQVEVVMEGRETELDKAVLEAIKDPLTHIVRNAVDHGIEAPALRLSRGKQPCGTLLLKAYHQSGKVHILISDDGGGIPVERLKQKALEKKLITAEQAAKLSEQETLQLIFLPGFSTAEKVTNISGRGVGMDVVRSNIEKIGGVVEIQSRLGVGSTFLIRIPLTLAIIPALLVSCGGGAYAIPQSHVAELLRLSDDSLAIEEICDSSVYRFRDGLLPLVFLESFLGLPKGSRAALDIVVIQAERGQFGLVVDQIIDSSEIVVKPLSNQLKGLNFYSGAAVLGDGKIALILDTAILAPQKSMQPKSQEQQEVSAQQSFLLLKNGASRLAFPMESVSRLERLPREQLELTGGQAAIQYRGGILPVAHLSSLLGLPPEPEESLLDLLVLQREEVSVGLVVEEILDVVEGEFPLMRKSSRFGVSGAVVIQEKITDVVDSAALFAAVMS